MHFVLVIPPTSATGDETYYFWVLQKWLHETRNQRTTIIVPPAYIPALKDNSRWEISEESCNFNQFLPSTGIGKNIEIILHTQSLSDASKDCPPTVEFVDLITREQPALTQFYVNTLEAVKKKTHEDVTVITWLNNSSLRSAAKIVNCLLVFNEFGPFRKPYYRPTAYWDHHGVNGETEVIDRWKREKGDFSSWKKTAYPHGGSADALKALLADPASHSTIKASARRAEIGLALQVETDSNALAYGNGWNNLALISYLKHSDKADKALLRLHPGGSAIYPGRIDLSPSPLEFLASVDEVWTVNSSLGIEAFFWGKSARIFGDSPIKSIATLHAGDREDFLEWFVLCYLVPFDLLFDFEYYLWRFANPSVSEIAVRHMTTYRSGSKQEWERIPFPPEADDRKLTVDFPGPRRAPLELVEQRLELSEQRKYIAKLEKDIRELYLMADERNALIAERDALLVERNAMAAEQENAKSELGAIKSSVPFRFLRRARLI